jgi:hypothetical protein
MSSLASCFSFHLFGRAQLQPKPASFALSRNNEGNGLFADSRQSESRKTANLAALLTSLSGT